MHGVILIAPRMKHADVFVLGNQRALEQQDAEALAEDIDDDAEPRTELDERPPARQQKTTWLDSGAVWSGLPFDSLYGNT